MNEKSISILFRKNASFLLPYLIFLIGVGVLLSMFPKSEIHLFINAHTHGKADAFFRTVTYLGDGIAVVFFTLAFLLYKVRASLLVGISGLLAGLTVQVLKHTLFSTMARPVKFFEGLHELYLIPGVESYGGNTFPSGHSASAFALCFCLCLLIENNLMKFLLFLIACTIGFSRVYLSQHFLNDVYAGSLLGLASVFLTLYLLNRVKPFAGAAWMDKALVQRKNTSS